jgi:transposase-like protein
MIYKNSCNIVSVGKRRDGGTRYWCLNHRADATAKYGRRGQQCRYAHFPLVLPDERLRLESKDFKGGIALWGAVFPVYDTTQCDASLGVHVHARKIPDGPKEIDGTYREVTLVGTSPSGSQELLVTKFDAIYNMVSRLFGFETKYVTCALCGYPHLDKDWFSVHRHQTHLCAGCGKLFRDKERGIGNPIAGAANLLGQEVSTIASANRKKSIKQTDFPGGLQIWGSNPAIIWTASRNEEAGIHVHAFHANGAIAIDDTYSTLLIDGRKLDPTMIRVYMAQNSLPHIAGRVVDIFCPQCGEPHFDIGENAYTPHSWHSCHSCGTEFQSKTRRKKTIGNPVVSILRELERYAPRNRQVHQTTMPIEAIPIY